LYFVRSVVSKPEAKQLKWIARSKFADEHVIPLHWADFASTCRQDLLSQEVTLFLPK
jgi:hypothetical protein